MILFPAIDLKEGLCVRLEQGDMARATVFHRDPAVQAQAFEPLQQCTLRRQQGRRYPAGRIAANCLAPLHASAVADARRRKFSAGPPELCAIHQGADPRWRQEPILNRNAVGSQAGINAQTGRRRRSAIAERRAVLLRAAAFFPATRSGARRAGLRGLFAASSMLPRQFLAPQRHA